jgi:pyrroloquinoline quinone (PQQ) biosynthesis protein C
MGLIDIDELVKELKDPWASSDPGPESVSKMAAAAYDLAQAAYGKKDPASRKLAEETLYYLNVNHCFAQPVHPGPNMVWSVLMRAKLAELRKEFGGCEPVSTAEMKKRLEDAVAKWGAYNHPILGVLAEDMDLRKYQVWAKNWFGSCYGFSAQLASLVQRTSGEAKKVVLENLGDEFDDTVTHDVLRVRFYEALGLRFADDKILEDEDWRVESTELLNLRTGLCSIWDPFPALGCFYSVEANWPPECRLHMDINKQRYDDQTIEYWTTHALADEHHSEEWLNVVLDTCRSDEQRASVVDGAIIQLRTRWRMYDAIAERIKVV